MYLRAPESQIRPHAEKHRRRQPRSRSSAVGFLQLSARLHLRGPRDCRDRPPLSRGSGLFRRSDHRRPAPIQAYPRAGSMNSIFRARTAYSADHVPAPGFHNHDRRGEHESWPYHLKACSDARWRSSQTRSADQITRSAMRSVLAVRLAPDKMQMPCVHGLHDGRLLSTGLVLLVLNVARSAAASQTRRFSGDRSSSFRGGNQSFCVTHLPLPTVLNA